MPHGAGVIHQRGDPAQFRINAIEQSDHFILAADIGPHGNRLGTQRANLIQYTQGSVFIRLVVDADAIALASGEQCRLGANATTAPRDDDDFVHGCGLPIQPDVQGWIQEYPSLTAFVRRRLFGAPDIRHEAIGRQWMPQ